MSLSTSLGPNPAASIAKERALTAFDTTAMNHVLEGSAEQAELVQQIYNQFGRDPTLAVNTKFYDLTKDEKRELTAGRISRLSRYLEADDNVTWQKRLHLLNTVDPQVGTRITVSLGLFQNCVRGNGTEAQAKYWLETVGAAHLRGAYGSFGMTELAHGSNVAGLETTATFDEQTNEFVISTPHVGATKWWIGGAAHSSTHCAVYARLISKGVDHGVKTFVVPLRDSNHDLMPGVAVGDIGSKFGREGIDNGWIQFLDVRIPREYMLCKWDKISTTGEVTNSPLLQLAYSALLDGRVTMVYDSFRTGSRFVTIALRYAVGRRQFGKGADGGEIQLLDYPLHQNRLLPHLAAVYAFSATGDKMNKYLEDVSKNLEVTVKSGNAAKIEGAINEMKNLFVLSASLKSTCTWHTATLIDECRQACGGHGYSAYSGFGQGYSDWVVQCTWEGDNNVLAMSAGKTIIQNGQKAAKGQTLQGAFSYLNAFEAGNKKPVLTTVGNALALLRAFQTLVGRMSLHASEILRQNNNNWEAISVSQVNISKVFAHTYILDTFIAKIAATTDAAVKSQLAVLGELYALSTLNQYASFFLQYQVITATLLADVQARITAVNAEVRPQVIGLTDAFKIPDFVINSALGAKDGNIYDNYFSVVKTQNSGVKAPYLKLLEDMLNRPDVAVRERHERSEQVLRTLRG